MSKKVDKSEKLVLLKESNDEKLYVFRPSIFKLYPKSGDMLEMNIKEIATHLVRLIHGYKIYILTDKNDVVKGSILFSNGGSYRYPFASKNDLIEGPDYTVPEFRGQGVAGRICNAAMNEFEKNYDTVYATVALTNIASLKRLKKSGFEVVGKLKADKIKRFHLDEDGNLVLVAYNPKKSV